MPRLLGDDMQETARLRPSQLSIEPNGEQLSTASMTLPPGEPRVPVRSWIELYTALGSAGIYRVSSRHEDEQGEQRLTLRHGLCVLEDAVIPGSGALTGDAKSILSAILARQPRALWALGDVAASPTLSLDYDNVNALEILQSALSKLTDFALSFDQSALPWKLGLVPLSGDEEAEGRLSRNVESVSIDEDDSELCTRVYFDDRAGYTDGPTIDTYGVIERVLTVPDGATDEEAREYARAYLDEHAHPTRTVTLDGWDLSGRTGESLDAFTLWKNARVPLPSLGQTLRDRVTALSYPDVFGDPERVRVSIGARERDLSDMLKALENRATSAEREATSTSKRVTENEENLSFTQSELEKAQEDIVDAQDWMSETDDWMSGTDDWMSGTDDWMSGTDEWRDDFVSDTSTQFDEVNSTLRSHGSSIESNSDELHKTYDELVKLGDTTATRFNQVDITLDDQRADINLKASSQEVSELGSRVSEAEIDIDGLNAAITLAASRTDEIEGRVTKAEVAIDGANAQISLKASSEDLNALEGRVKSAEIAIDGQKGEISIVAQDAKNAQSAADVAKATADNANASSAELWNWAAAAGNVFAQKSGIISTINVSPESITIAANRVNLVGFVTAEQFAAEVASIKKLFTDLSVSGNAVITGTLNASGGSVLSGTVIVRSSNLSIGGTNGSWQNMEVVTGVSTRTRYCKSPSDITIEIKEVSGVSKERIYYFGYT